MKVILYKIIFFYMSLLLSVGSSLRCDRRPYGSTVQASPSDGRYKLSIVGIKDNAYVPDQLYNVQITATDAESRFAGFMISAEGDSKQDPHNPRRVIVMFPGDLKPLNPDTTKFSKRCPFSVENAMSSMKSSVEVYWHAPNSGNGCVTLRATVVENNEIWFEGGAPLTQKLCEDTRQPDDVAVNINYECNICDEAKYEISFTGIWSRNTHPLLYPENDWVLKYSDLVGASHAANFVLWTPGSLASDGLQELAEHANTTKFEMEIREKIDAGVRTIIKGKGHDYHNMGEPTYAFFRTDKDNHLVTVAVGIHPSPDWFLGVSRFELCQDNAWLANRELNLYPWDAGTDSGVSYESSNKAMIPHDTIARVQMASFDRDSPFYQIDMKSMHPFGKLNIKLIRTYHRECEDSTEEPAGGNPDEDTLDKDDQGESEDGSEMGENEEVTDTKQQEPEEPSRYHNPDIASGVLGGTTTEAPIVIDPESSEDCPMSQWTEWSPCEGTCEGDKLKGYKWRERYHLVDGVGVEKYDPNASHKHVKEVSKYCKSHFEDFERNACEDVCPESEVYERRMGLDKPGFMYYTKKRDLRKMKNEDV